MTLDWETYRKMMLYHNGLKDYMRKPTSRPIRLKLLNEITSVKSWIRRAEKLLNIEVTGEWEFSEMVKSPYFKAIQELPNPELADYQRWLAMTPWERIVSDPEKLNEYRAKKRQREALKKYLKERRRDKE